jgi:hypothetical protein
MDDPQIPNTGHHSRRQQAKKLFKSHIGVGLQVVGAVPDPVIRYLDSKLCTCEPGETINLGLGTNLDSESRSQDRFDFILKSLEAKVETCEEPVPESN